MMADEEMRAEIEMLRGEIARCRQRSQLLGSGLDIARKQALRDAGEIASLRAIVEKVAELEEAARIYDGKECIFCTAYYGAYQGKRPYDTHDDDCAFAEARAYLAAVNG